MQVTATRSRCWLQDIVPIWLYGVWRCQADQSHHVLVFEKWWNRRTQNVIDVKLTCHVSINDCQWCPLLATYPSPHHDAPSTKWQSSINCEQTVPAFINEYCHLPVTWLPMSYIQDPSQSQMKMLRYL